jgi:tRNA threonylcarbamoyladenosine biosynthesis protein TsaB
MILGIRTDGPVAEFYLYDGEVLRAEHTWQADRQLAYGLLEQLETFLRSSGLTFKELTGLFVFRGPGSFTGLRIGITVMNTMAYVLGIPIVGADGDQWRGEAVEKLTTGKSDEIVLPEYGAEARITKPRK